MINLKGHRIVDLSAELVSRVTRLDATIEEGKRDVYNMPWIVEETINERDGTIEHLVACNIGTVAEWPIGGVSGHMGSHVQLGVGHNDNWSGSAGMARNLKTASGRLCAKKNLASRGAKRFTRAHSGSSWWRLPLGRWRRTACRPT